MDKTKTICLMCLLFSMTGCSIFNPYASEPLCKKTDDFGHCIDVTGAYESSVKGKKNTVKTGQIQDITPPRLSAEGRYRKSLYSELKQLIDKPETPMLRPPRVRRILLLGYEDNAYFTSRYAYIIVEPASFILDEYAGKPKDTAFFEPFKSEIK